MESVTKRKRKRKASATSNKGKVSEELSFRSEFYSDAKKEICGQDLAEIIEQATKDLYLKRPEFSFSNGSKFSSEEV